jgi:hypothetical protein
LNLSDLTPAKIKEITYSSDGTDRWYIRAIDNTMFYISFDIEKAVIDGYITNTGIDWLVPFIKENVIGPHYRA